MWLEMRARIACARDDLAPLNVAVTSGYRLGRSSLYPWQQFFPPCFGRVSQNAGVAGHACPLQCRWRRRGRFLSPLVPSGDDLAGPHDRKITNSFVRAHTACAIPLPTRPLHTFPACTFKESLTHLLRLAVPDIQRLATLVQQITAANAKLRLERADGIVDAWVLASWCSMHHAQSHELYDEPMR